MTETAPGADLSVFAQLSASLGSVAAELRAERQWRERMAAECWYVQAPAITLPAGSPFTYSPPLWGPNTGFAWAVQRITFFPGVGGDESDNVTIYRGHSPLDVQQQNALNTLAQPSGFVAAVAWHPGRTGLILMPDESLVFSGTITTGAAVSVDVIQVTTAMLSQFLM